MSITTILIKRNPVSGSIPSAANMTQGELALNYDVNDGTVFYKDISGSIKGIRSAAATSASYALTSSYSSVAQSVINSPASSSYATTASWAALALSSSYAGTASLLLGSVATASYSVTSSFAQQAANATTANSATSASYATTSSLAAQAITASYAVTAAFSMNGGGGGSSISSSWASSSISASYALTASFALNGGGGGSFGPISPTFQQWDPMKAPTLPSVYDDEFTVAGAPNAKWISSVNDFTASVVLGASIPWQNALVLQKVSAGTAASTLTQMVPSGTWAIYTRLRYDGQSDSNNVSLTVRDNASGGKQIKWGLTSVGGVLKLGGYNMTNTGSFNSTIYENSNTVFDRDTYIQIAWDGTNIRLRASTDGVTYSEYGTSTFITTPARFGFSIDAGGGTTSPTGSLAFFRVITGSFAQDPVGGFRTIVDGTNVAAVSSSYAVTSSYAAAAGTRDIINYTTGLLGSASFETGTLPLGKSFMILQVSASSDTRIRLYTSASYRNADLTRAIGVIPVGKHGLICDIIPTGSDSLVIPLAPPAWGTNLETPVTGSIAYSIQNRLASPMSVSIAITRFTTAT